MTMTPTRVSAEMITEMAMGLGSAPEIAARYDINEAEFLELSSYAWYQKMLAERREQLISEGLTFKTKMGALAEDILVDAYRLAMLSDSVQNKLDVGKYLTKIAGLEPMPNQLVNPGGGFSISIVLPQVGASPQRTVTIEATPVPTESTESDAEESEDMLGDRPAFPQLFTQTNEDLGHVSNL